MFNMLANSQLKNMEKKIKLMKRGNVVTSNNVPVPKF